MIYGYLYLQGSKGEAGYVGDVGPVGLRVRLFLIFHTTTMLKNAYVIY